MSTETAPLDGRDARWEKHRAERRNGIIDAAIAVIEREPAGAVIHVRQIAEEAGLGRAVVYRHFADRADLDRAVQAEVLDRLRRELEPTVQLVGTVESIIRGIVVTYVRWAAAHPGLHRIAQQESPGEDGTSALEVTVKGIVDQVAMLITIGAELLDVELSDDDRAGLDPLVFGLVGSAFAAVRRWLWRPVLEPDVEVFGVLLADSIWYLIEGHARARGLELDPTVPVEELFGSVAGTEA